MNSLKIAVLFVALFVSTASAGGGHGYPNSMPSDPPALPYSPDCCVVIHPIQFDVDVNINVSGTQVAHDSDVLNKVHVKGIDVGGNLNVLGIAAGNLISGPCGDCPNGQVGWNLSVDNLVKVHDLSVHGNVDVTGIAGINVQLKTSQ